MAGAQTMRVVPMKVFVKKNQIPPMRVGPEEVIRAVNRPAAVLIPKKDAVQPAGKLGTVGYSAAILTSDVTDDNRAFGSKLSASALVGSFYWRKAAGGLLLDASATGAAWSAVQLGTGQVVVAFFGDGAINQGALLEAFNMAALWRLPVVFVCESNGYATTVPTATTHAGSVAGRGAAFGIPVLAGDGMDPEAVLRDYAILDEAGVLLASWTRHAIGEITVHDLATGALISRVDLPGLGSVGGLAERPEGGHEAWFGYTDYLTPGMVLHFDAQTSTVSTWATAPEDDEGATLACEINCFTVIDASARVSPIIIATETHATAL